MKIQSLLFTLFVILFSSFNCYADSSPLEEQYNFSFYENSNLQLLNVCVYQGKFIISLRFRHGGEKTTNLC
ncbi:hypothetical protein Tresu_2618 (plasmid) [Treponema succinifaciens DSM 2489]|uniref:Lipoprotein n=1 Tax=Treponema succinifaciens (strain ATCC 33096 / DSM 2489 / 6091) TaxID=869209 RepID=F2NYI0_TRES6|nr:hypothetical protein Tresu_2618 [Treponema succinifaciens DSM 2489]